MKTTTLSVTIGRTINLGNFNSLRVEASAGATLENDDKLDDVRAALVAECMKGLRAAKASGGENL